MLFWDKVFGKQKGYMTKGIYPINVFLNENAQQLGKIGLLATIKADIGRSQTTHYDKDKNIMIYK